MNTIPLQEESAFLTAREQMEHAKAAYDAAKQAYDQGQQQHERSGKLFIVPKRSN